MSRAKGIAIVDDNKIVALDDETMKVLRVENIKNLIAPSEDSARRIEAIGGAGAILNYLVNGLTLDDTSKKLGLSREQLIKWMAFHRDALEPAMQASAMALADDAAKYLEDAANKGEELTAAQAGIAKARAEHAMKIAGLRDRVKFNEKSIPQEVTLSQDSRPVFTLNFLSSPKREEKIIENNDSTDIYDTNE